MADFEFVNPGARIALKGVVRALEDIDGRDLVSCQIAVGQALCWAVSLDERLSREHGGRSYRVIRDADPDGRYLEGARLARNAITHGAVVMQSPQEGLVFPLVFPLDFGGYRWRPLAEVLENWSDRKEPSDAQKASH